MKRLFIVMVLVGLVGCGQQNLSGSSAQGSPAPGVTVKANPPAAMAVVGIIDGEHGFLLGGVQGGAWIDPQTAGASLTADQRYGLYSPAARIGEVIGAAPQQLENAGRCGPNPVVALQSTALTKTLALNADWEVFPRPVTEIPLDTAAYHEAVQTFLQTQGISNSDVLLTRIVRVDLEGDGVEEVLINATRLLSPEGYPEQLTRTAAAGDYSFVMLQRTVDGKAVSIPVVGEFYRKLDKQATPSEHTLRSLADLNGDGDLELVVDSRYYEGYATSIHEITGNEAKSVLGFGCGA